MTKTGLITCLILIALATVVFRLDPAIDLQAARYFYQHGQGFAWADSAWANGFRHGLYALVWVVNIVTLLLLIGKVIRPRLPLPSINANVYVLTVFIVVPFLLVNVVFKDHFGRPRPRQIELFAGTLQFQPVWNISSQCDTNCSFVCGDAAVVFAFWLFLPFFERRRWRMAYGAAVLLLGIFYGLIRMGQGGHFLSDVVFAGLLSYLGVWCVYRLFYSFPKPRPGNNG